MADATLVYRLLLFTALAFALCPATPEAQDSIATILDDNGLPIGLLPASVQSFSLSEEGAFEVRLDHSCYARFAYEVYYAQTITGKISYGNITGLSGIQAKEAFFWVPVTGIRMESPDSGYICFDVGPISKRLPLSQFEVVPDCKIKSTSYSVTASVA